MSPRPQPLATQSLRTLVAGLGLAAALASPGLAQSERFLLGPGSTIGPATTIEPKTASRPPMAASPVTPRS